MQIKKTRPVKFYAGLYFTKFIKKHKYNKIKQKNVKNPVPSISYLQDWKNLISSLVDPRDWCDELQSGPYKGHSTLEKNTLKSPFWGIRQYRQIDKFTDDLETSILYYTRPY